MSSDHEEDHSKFPPGWRHHRPVGAPRGDSSRDTVGPVRIGGLTNEEALRVAWAAWDARKAVQR